MGPLLASAGRGSRGGMTLVEVMVVIALLLLLIGVAIPAVSSILDLQMRSAARKLVLTYQKLHDEAILQNVAFRVGFDLDAGKYVIEVGEPGALIFDDPEEREDYEEEQRSKLTLMNEDERTAYRARRKPFEELSERIQEDFELPPGVMIGGVFTPQYGKMRVPTALGGELDDVFNDEGKPLGKEKIWTYIFPNGMSEHTVIWIVDEDDPEDGYTIEIEPLSGEIQLHGELVDWDDSYDFVPDDGPKLP